MVPESWSKPVDLEEFKAADSGEKPVSVPPTLQPFYHNHSEVKEAISAAPRANIVPAEVTFQRLE